MFQMPAPDPFNTLGWKLFFGAVGPAIGGAIAYFAGWAQSRRAARLKKVAIASAALAEVQRIRLHIGGIPEGVDVEQRRVVKTPRVHAWFEGVIAEAAQVSAEIPLSFIRLQEALDELGGAEAEMRKWLDALDRVTTTVQVSHEGSERDRAMVQYDKIDDRVEAARAELRVAMGRVESELFAADVSARRALPRHQQERREPWLKA